MRLRTGRRRPLARAEERSQARQVGQPGLDVGRQLGDQGRQLVELHAAQASAHPIGRDVCGLGEGGDQADKIGRECSCGGPQAGDSQARRQAASSMSR